MPQNMPPKLGPYEILGTLGAGGMGRVYRARDTRLGRKVALKVLPDEVLHDKKRQARFEQEARSASALNHPNIVCIYDIGSDQGIIYVVSELVEGESIRALIARGPVPPAKLLDIAIQVAEGVAAAHSAGIVHRDLKPENILLTPAGRAKIIDFGLAKQVEFPTGEARESAETLVMTEPGVIMGSFAYMSPEQVRAQPAGFRSDLFSLGDLFYEMASGRPAFSGRSQVDLMLAVLKDDPPPLPSAISPDLNSIIRRCLEKLPERRFQTSADLAFALQRARDALNRNQRVKPRWVLGAAGAGAAALMAALAGGVVYQDRLRTHAALRSVETTVTAPKLPTIKQAAAPAPPPPLPRATAKSGQPTPPQTPSAASAEHLQSGTTHKEITLDPAALARYVGVYKMGSSNMLIALEGAQLSAQLTGQNAFPISPESETMFFLKAVDAQIEFPATPAGARAGQLTLHQNGRDVVGTRLPDAEAKPVMDAGAATARRIKDQTASPGSEAALRRFIEEIQTGQPNYDLMSASLAAATRQQLPQLKAGVVQLGVIQSVDFKSVDPAGHDTYQVKFDKGWLEYRIWLAPDGKIEGATVRPVTQ